MNKNCLLPIIFIICSLLVSGCAENNLYSQETIEIGIVGTASLPDEAHVVYSELTPEQLLTTVSTDYNAIIIGEDLLETVSQQHYIDVFYEQELRILFMNSSKGWVPFLQPSTLDLPKTYNDYNTAPRNQAIFAHYQQDGPPLISAIMMERDTLSAKEFKKLLQPVFDEFVH